MIRTRHLLLLLVLFTGSAVMANDEQTPAQQTQDPNSRQSFQQASDSVQRQLDESLAELTALREQVAAEKIPLSRDLSDREEKLIKVRQKYQQVSRLLDTRTLDLGNLTSEIKSRKEEAAYVSNLMGEYIRNFESLLHIAEVQRYRSALEEAKLAAENSNLSEEQVYQAQIKLLVTSIERLNDAAGGVTFEGTAVDTNGRVNNGTFAMIGPAALFTSKDGANMGTAEQRLGSLEPAIIPFGDPLDAQAAANVIANGGAGTFPLDPTLGNAHKVEDVKETLPEHIKKGGPVMYPIFALAGAALLVAVFKWLSMVWIRPPSQKKIKLLLQAVASHDLDSTMQAARRIRGPVGKMLRAGAEHLQQPRELIEEVMYEKVLSTRLSLQRMLPFVALTSSSAPLLGLLGTVTGIMNTFTLMTVFGTGDVKTLSSGISEALITTEYGLYVAIPSLLLYAFLSRKSKNIVDDMEKAAVAFLNQVSKTPYPQESASGALNSDRVEELLRKLAQAQPAGSESKVSTRDLASGMMDTRLVSVGKAATVGEVINRIRASGTGEDIDHIFVVDEQGKYFGHVLTHQLLTRPEQTVVGALADTKPLFVRIDTHRNELKRRFDEHSLTSVPVLDHNDRLVGRVVRSGNGDSGRA
jgi:biopolymer transport protein ExbB